MGGGGVKHIDVAISYTYRHIIDDDVIKYMQGNIINIHNSYLPYNRGASPNLWSLAEGTPRGVTIHYINAALDKGFIIAQRIITEGDGQTLSSSYDNLHRNAIDLFKETWKCYEFWSGMKKQAIGTGTYHSLADTKRMLDGIESYSMKIEDFKKRFGSK